MERHTTDGNNCRLAATTRGSMWPQSDTRDRREEEALVFPDGWQWVTEDPSPMKNPCSQRAAVFSASWLVELQQLLCWQSRVQRLSWSRRTRWSSLTAAAVLSHANTWVSFSFSVVMVIWSFVPLTLSWQSGLFTAEVRRQDVSPDHYNSGPSLEQRRHTGSFSSIFISRHTWPSRHFKVNKLISLMGRRRRRRDQCEATPRLFRFTCSAAC